MCAEAGQIARGQATSFPRPCYDNRDMRRTRTTAAAYLRPPAIRPVSPRPPLKSPATPQPAWMSGLASQAAESDVGKPPPLTCARAAA